MAFAVASLPASEPTPGLKRDQSPDGTVAHIWLGQVVVDGLGARGHAARMSLGSRMRLAAAAAMGWSMLALVSRVLAGWIAAAVAYALTKRLKGASEELTARSDIGERLAFSLQRSIFTSSRAAS